MMILSIETWLSDAYITYFILLLYPPFPDASEMSKFISLLFYKPRLAQLKLNP